MKSMNVLRSFKRVSFTAVWAVALMAPNASFAQVCPFDNGGSTLQNDGLVLTRYALGLRGAPMVANTSFAAADAATIESNIACPACGLRVTDDRDGLNNPIFTATDATIISRKLAGFEGASLTNGLALGSGTRNTPAAVQSFLLAGCGATGGTVTSVTAGAGLTGGTITASGTLAADTNYLQRRVSTACAPGRYVSAIAADGTPTCGLPPAGGSGTVTSVGAGTGLVANGANVVGGAIVSNGLMELANGYILPQACTMGQVPKSAGGGSWVCAEDNAFTQGGNAFGAPGVMGTTDGQPLTVGIGTGNGLRVIPSFVNSAPNIILGSGLNTISTASSVVGTTVGGGQLNSANGAFATISGGNSNTAAGNWGTVSGGDGNIVNGAHGTISGGFQSRAAGEYSSVSGGWGNSAAGNYSVVGGGQSNTAVVAHSTVAGGNTNTASGVSSAVGRGGGNTASGDVSTVAGGESNEASWVGSTVAGGRSNKASGGSSTVAGGELNKASALYSTVAGGKSNTAYGSWSTVAGGDTNHANGLHSTVAGGNMNAAGGNYSTVAGGTQNTATGWASTVAGGAANGASGDYSTVAGGFENAASGARSFAAGHRATASDPNEFVWNGSSTAWNPKTVPLWGGNTTATFNVRADRGFFFQTGGGTACTLGAGGAGWNCTSDHSLKEKIIAVSPRAVLEKVASLPVSTWVIKGFDQLHMGPMSQDFRAAFGLGRDDKTINSTDAQGVALAAIQGLNQKLAEQIKAKDETIANLSARLAVIEVRLGLK